MNKHKKKIGYQIRRIVSMKVWTKVNDAQKVPGVFISQASRIVDRNKSQMWLWREVYSMAPIL